ncbi:hypothetical protein Aspvir_001801 [Aspergillus viridinutans]|uniref:Phytanoyl-CoA dioxygenase n=1 Tax=Aspergillus viridinutans TaxID=75553 RepID=A0A9P3C143_ASPVI|nr:uncharacterized protein Aspvir_001801 [Aspergillus viridinutans]GIK06158.1 hypothetical protein Aspvir_001801 [Aspergillus viridinutans]
MPLTEEQRQHWLEHGFVKIPQCFTKEDADNWTASIWARLGISPKDKSTWNSERVNMPGHTVVDVKDFAPKAWDAIYNWHNDGDWFTHFLDSGEQALLVIPLFSDIKSKRGGTVICTDGIGLVAKHLYDHPEGTWPSLASRSGPTPPPPEGGKQWRDWAQDPQLTRSESFHEATGQAGDVYLLHPFMLHSASRNLLREVRIITNPPVSLKEPFNYNRPDGKYSLVEQKTLKDLGRPEGLPEWKITREREMLTPARVQIQEDMRQKELERLNQAGSSVTKLGTAKPLESYYPS